MKHRTTIVAFLAVALSACWDDGTIIRACASACEKSGQGIIRATPTSCECGLIVGPDAGAEVPR